MDRTQLRQRLLDALLSVAPEIDPASIDPARPLRRQVDLDSADWLNFMLAVHEALGVDVADADAPRLSTLDQWVDHCAARLPGGTPR